MEREPGLARLAVVEALEAGPRILESRAAVLAELAGAVDRGRSAGPAGDGSSPVTAEGVVGAIFTVLHSRLLERDGEPLTSLVGPLMSMIMLPYLGADVARSELERPPRAPRPLTGRPVKHSDPLEGLDMRLTYRTVRVLVAIGEKPGVSNRDVARSCGHRRSRSDIEAAETPRAPGAGREPRPHPDQGLDQCLVSDGAGHPCDARHAQALSRARSRTVRPSQSLLLGNTSPPSRYRPAVGEHAKVLRALLWRLLGLVAFMAAVAFCVWLLDGGLGAALRGANGSGTARISLAALTHDLAAAGWAALSWAPVNGASFAGMLGAAVTVAAVLLCTTRSRARGARSYVRLQVNPYRADSANLEGLAAMYQSLHKRILRRWWRRLLWGQPSLALEVHRTTAESESSSPGEHDRVWLAVVCPAGLEAIVEAAIRAAYPNCRLRPSPHPPPPPRAVLRLKKQAEFIKRIGTLERDEQLREPPMNRLMSVMAACSEPASVQLALTPTPALFERHAKHLYKRHEARLSREHREHLVMRDRSLVEDAELRGGLEVQHRPLFFTDVRVIASNRLACERIASELRALGAENRLVERGTALRNGLFAPLPPARPARGGKPAALTAQGCVRVLRAGPALAVAVSRVRHGAVRADRHSARPGPAERPAPAQRSRHAARCVGRSDDP